MGYKQRKIMHHCNLVRSNKSAITMFVPVFLLKESGSGTDTLFLYVLKTFITQNKSKLASDQDSRTLKISIAPAQF